MTAAGPRDPVDGAASLEHGGASGHDAGSRAAVDGFATSTPPGDPPAVARSDRPQGMIPGRGRRRTTLERVAMRVLATGGIIGIAVALGAVLVARNVDGWIVGLAIGLTSVILAAVLWSSRQL
jgi:hypothetical protein